MAKYIIDIASPNVRNEYIVYWTYDGLEAKRVSDLTPYTEPDLEQVRNESFKNGYDAACKDIDIKSKTNAAYRKGLEDAWEAARKIYLPVEYGGIPADALRQIFDNKSASGIFKKVSASEAVEKIRQYEQEKDAEIKVGDEVIATSGKAVIVGINDDKDKARYIYPDSTLEFDNICNLSKTGRHFPEIATVLEKMRGEQDG